MVVRLFAMSALLGTVFISCGKKSTPSPTPKPSTRELNIKFLTRNGNISLGFAAGTLYLQTKASDTTLANMTPVSITTYKSDLAYTAISFLGDGNVGNSSIITNTVGGTWQLDASGTILTVTPNGWNTEVSKIYVASDSFGSYTKFSDGPHTFRHGTDPAITAYGKYIVYTQIN